jgi:hypothetical protein
MDSARSPSEGSVKVKYTRADIERFEAKVGPPNERGCIEWTAYRNEDGYGQFRLGGKMVRAHRLSLVIHQGIEIPPPEIEALHSCDNPPCVNPDHLRWGTPKDNGGDKKKRGRSPRGEKNGKHKLTSRQVMEIHQLYSSGGYSQTELGRRFGVHQTQIGFIVRGEQWTEEYAEFQRRK